MRYRTWVIVITAGALATIASPAYAWGPAAHVGLGSSILGGLSFLPAAVAAILARHKIAYLYGNVAADIVFAKRLSRVRQFCHHWSTAFRLLDESRDDRARAFAYGYLSHLAADTVAHGKYVPRQIILSNCSVNFGHFYWELRAETAEPRASWDRLEEVFAEAHDHHHADLEGHITDTFLPYELNRLMFDRMNALAMRKSVRRTIHIWNRLSRWDLSPIDQTAYRTECLGRIRAILADGRASPLLREDPNGASAFMQLRVYRRSWRRMRRRGSPVKQRMLEASNGLSPEPLCARDDVAGVLS